jgi:hypothetical protein
MDIEKLIKEMNNIHIKTPKERLNELYNKKYDKMSKISIKRQKRNRRKLIKKIRNQIQDEIKKNELYSIDKIIFHFNKL